MGRRKSRKEEGQGAGDRAGLSVLDLASDFAKQCALAASEAPKPVFGTGNFKKKVVSESLAVLPRQVPEQMAYDKANGVSVEFDSHGRPIFDNSAHFRRYCKAQRDENGNRLRHKGY